MRAPRSQVLPKSQFAQTITRQAERIAELEDDRDKFRRMWMGLRASIAGAKFADRVIAKEKLRPPTKGNTP